MYKIGKYIIDADSPEQAVKVVKCMDASVDYDYLLRQEKSAVEDYKNAIKITNNKDELRVLAHILNEEMNHIKELENLRVAMTSATNSLNDALMSATQENILMEYAVKYNFSWNEIEKLFKEFTSQGFNSKDATTKVIEVIKSR